MAAAACARGSRLAAHGDRGGGDRGGRQRNRGGRQRKPRPRAHNWRSRCDEKSGGSFVGKKKRSEQHNRECLDFTAQKYKKSLINHFCSSAGQRARFQAATGGKADLFLYVLKTRHRRLLTGSITKKARKPEFCFCAPARRKSAYASARSRVLAPAAAIRRENTSPRSLAAASHKCATHNRIRIDAKRRELNSRVERAKKLI